MRPIRSKTGARRLQKSLKDEFSSLCEVAFLLQDWDDAYNVGGLFRVADALGSSELVMSGHTPVPPNPMVSVTSLGSHRRVPWRRFQAHEEAAEALQAEGWELIAVEIAEGAVPYFKFVYPPRTCLVLGNEGAGVYRNVLNKCSAAVLIPMQGAGRSLNVHVSGAIVGFHARYGAARKD